MIECKKYCKEKCLISEVCFVYIFDIMNCKTNREIIMRKQDKKQGINVLVKEYSGILCGWYISRYSHTGYECKIISFTVQIDLLIFVYELLSEQVTGEQ